MEIPDKEVMELATLLKVGASMLEELTTNMKGLAKHLMEGLE